MAVKQPDWPVLTNGKHPKLVTGRVCSGHGKPGKSSHGILEFYFSGLESHGI